MLVCPWSSGCELLKNLLLTGFRDLTVIDLDTIDVSNLNRQFLFRPHHVGHSKALVARDAVAPLSPEASITAFHGNIAEARFGPTFFASFQLVISALDNVAARRSVNVVASWSSSSSSYEEICS